MHFHQLYGIMEYTLKLLLGKILHQVHESEKEKKSTKTLEKITDKIITSANLIYHYCY
jgi:hypothetical protein